MSDLTVETAEEAMLNRSSALSNEEAMLNLSPTTSSEEALLDPSLSPNEQEGEDNLLNQAIDMSGAAFLCSQDLAAANEVGNWNLDEDAAPGVDRHEESTLHNLHPTVFVGTRTVMTATSEISTPMLILTAQSLSMVQRAANTSFGVLHKSRKAGQTIRTNC